MIEKIRSTESLKLTLLVHFESSASIFARHVDIPDVVLILKEGLSPVAKMMTTRYRFAGLSRTERTTTISASHGGLCSMRVAETMVGSQQFFQPSRSWAYPSEIAHNNNQPESSSMTNEVLCYFPSTYERHAHADAICIFIRHSPQTCKVVIADHDTIVQL